MTYRIEAPNKAYTGLVAGIPFVNGLAEHVPAIPDYFRRHKSYTLIEEDIPSAVEEPQPEPQPEAKKDAKK